MPNEKKQLEAQKLGQNRPRGGGGGMGGPGAVGGMTAPVEKAADFKGTLRKLLNMLRTQYWRLILAVIFGILSVAGTIVGPRILANATNELAAFVQKNFMYHMNPTGAAPSIDFAYIARVLVTMLTIYIVASFFSYLQSRLTVTMTQALIWRLREDISEKLDALPLKFFDSQTYGEILSKITIDIDLINTNLQQVMTQTLTSVITLVGIVAIMFTISWALSLITLIALPLTLLLTSFIAPKAQRFFGRQQAQMGELNGQIEENYSGHAIIKAFNREEVSVERFRQTNERLYDSAWKAQFLTSIMMPLINFLTNLQYVLIVVIAAVLTRPRVLFMGANIGGLQIGFILAFIQYVNAFQQPLVQTAQIANVIQGTIAAAERVFALLEEPEEEPELCGAAGGAAAVDAAAVGVAAGDAAAGDAAAADAAAGDAAAVGVSCDGAGDGVSGAVAASAATRHDDRPEGHVRLTNLSFDYSKDAPLIRDLNLEALPGKMIAIVGPTGAGKTTIVNLLMRFYEIDSGSIEIDGINTRDMTRADVRRLFGMVLQDTWLFSGTIRENIAYGRDGASDEEIRAAADAALADHFIRTLPDGYDTVLSEDAGNISVGQRQLLTIARAVLADAPILILDEATSSVDTRTEQLIQAAMARLMKGRTSFVIAHRLSTIRDADVILVMQHGRIVESGTHEELLAAGGAYAELYNSQFAEDEDA